MSLRSALLTGLGLGLVLILSLYFGDSFARSRPLGAPSGDQLALLTPQSAEPQPGLTRIPGKSVRFITPQPSPTVPGALPPFRLTPGPLSPSGSDQSLTPIVIRPARTPLVTTTSTPTVPVLQGPSRRITPRPLITSTPRPAPPFVELTPETQPPSDYVPPPTEISLPQPTPVPLKTPYPKLPSKLGVGVYDSGGEMISDLSRTKAPIILLMDPTEDFAREVRRNHPKAFIIGRLFLASQPLDNPTRRGEELADRVGGVAVPLRGVIDAWMGYNEVTTHNDYAGYGAYNSFGVAFARRLQGTYNIPAVAGNDGPSTIEPEDYARYFAESIAESRYFGVHTYSPSTETTMRSPFGGHMVFRHRDIKAALDRAGIASGPYIITESGLWNGWRGVVTAESMASDYLWLSDQIEQDDYVLGMTIFGLFRSERWANFNVAGTVIIDRIGAYNAAHGL